MKINRDTLLAACAGPLKLASKRTTLPILNTLHLSASGNQLTVTGTNLDTRVEVICECEGDLPPTCVPALLFCNLLKRCSDSISLTAEKNRLAIEGGHRATIATMSAAEYPPAPEVKGEATTIDCGALADGIEAVRGFTFVQDSSRPIFEWIYAERDSDGFSVVATDGRRLARAHFAGPAPRNGIWIWPDSSPEICAALRGECAEIVQSENWLLVRHSAGRFFLRNFAGGNFPNWKQAIPTAPKNIGTVKRDAMLEVCSAAAVFQTEKAHDTKLMFGKKSVEVSAGDASNAFKSEMAGEFSPLKITVNIDYICDSLRALGPEIKFECDDELSPMVLTSGNALHVVMPVRTS